MEYYLLSSGYKPNEPEPVPQKETTQGVDKVEIIKEHNLNKRYDRVTAEKEDMEIEEDKKKLVESIKRGLTKSELTNMDDRSDLPSIKKLIKLVRTYTIN